jgi:ElaB/YqjD/DUF883 family membrane-anchored ribosome-binding protein
MQAEEMAELLAEKARVAEEEAALLQKKAADAEEELQKLRVTAIKVKYLKCNPYFVCEKAHFRREQITFEKNDEP